MSAGAYPRIVEALREAGLLVSAAETLGADVILVTDDSRSAVPGTLFLAVRGVERDGHEFIDGASAAGAVAAMVDDASRTTLPAIVVSDTRRAAAVAAAAFHGFPARQLRLVGVTGTNGKTTTVGMLRHLLDEPDGRAASIGTLGVVIGSEGRELPGGGGLTTPGPVELQRVLRALVDAGVRTVAMETSSHALHQRRVEGLRFAAGIFTNLTRDHLDYHVTMEAYLAAKALLIDALADDGVAVVNADDDAWGALRPAPRTLRFGINDGAADVRAEGVRFMPRGSCWTLVCGSERHEITLPLIGDFNISNALAAAGAAWGLGLAPHQIAGRLATMPQVPGRLELISEEPAVLRDYAHTPDALERALAAVRPFATGRLIVVFGCGGDRDRGKRPEMGRIAQTHADLAIVTSDNPRTEDPQRILDDVEAGMDGPHERIEDRRTAIAHALDVSRPGDVIVLAGKGHETYQIRGTVKHPFDERIIVRHLIAERTT
ncbi:MAG: UDP-N-acetylmuramoyl-L-alanyl-D-glutamate--2,6-diaminopimelate ligase [Gemmatimonadetes bacterium]|nr:UDP-N-acetylmuramoyl-L-alanyl-D-glutamate--2,6-diaminopimelate ligase [Gemmatimonadota bacterium]